MKELPFLCFFLFSPPAFLFGRALSQPPLDRPGTRTAGIEGKDLTVYVPLKARSAPGKLVAGVDRIYGAMSGEAGFEGRGRPHFPSGGWTDPHNRSSFAAPFSLVDVDPTRAFRPVSTIFHGYRPLERTPVHEFPAQIPKTGNTGSGDSRKESSAGCSRRRP